MHLKRKTVLGFALTIALLLAFLIGLHSWKPHDYSLGLEWTGITAKNLSAFNVSVTNKVSHGSSPSRIQFQWVNSAGQLGSCHASLWKNGAVGTAYIGIPADARKLRILLCNTPGQVRMRLAVIAQKLPRSLNRLVPQKWIYDNDVHTPFPWVANPALTASADVRQPSR